MEVTGFIIVYMELRGGTSAFPFSVTVTPLEQSPVSAEGNSVVYCNFRDLLKRVWLTGDVDFNTTTLTATFATGMTMSYVSVPVIVDNITEDLEEFELRLDVPSSLGSAITADGRNMATGMITKY